MVWSGRGLIVTTTGDTLPGKLESCEIQDGELLNRGMIYRAVRHSFKFR